MAESVFITDCEECGETVDQADTHECKCGKTICESCECSDCEK